MNSTFNRNRFVKQAFAKYGEAICSNLYPLQAKKLKDAFIEYSETGKTTIDDNFVLLAFDLIICDLEQAETESERGQ